MAACDIFDQCVVPVGRLGAEEGGLIHALVIENTDRAHDRYFRAPSQLRCPSDLGRVYEVLHIVAAVFAKHDGQRHAVVQVRAGIVGVGAVGVLAAGFLGSDPDIEDNGVFQDLGQNIGREY